jgi:hypothetical protein
MNTSSPETPFDRKRRALMLERLALMDAMLPSGHREKPANAVLTAIRHMADRLVTIVISVLLLTILLALSPALVPLSLLSKHVREAAGSVLVYAVWTLISY